MRQFFQPAWRLAVDWRASGDRLAGFVAFSFSAHLFGAQVTCLRYAAADWGVPLILGYQKSVATPTDYRAESVGRRRIIGVGVR